MKSCSIFYKTLYCAWMVAILQWLVLVLAVDISSIVFKSTLTRVKLVGNILETWIYMELKKLHPIDTWTRVKSNYFRLEFKRLTVCLRVVKCSYFVILATFRWLNSISMLFLPLRVSLSLVRFLSVFTLILNYWGVKYCCTGREMKLVFQIQNISYCAKLMWKRHNVKNKLQLI